MTPRRSPTALTLVLFAAAGLSGCSGSSGLSTASVLGGGDKPAAPAVAENSPTLRALQVGATAARAGKCGYNFDGNKLRANFLASEAAQAPGADQSNVIKTYDTAYAGVTKAAASQPGYCSDSKTKDIKADLTRHLAGDYTPSPPKRVVEEDSGLFSGWSGDSGAASYKQTLPTDNSND